MIDNSLYQLKQKSESLYSSVIKWWWSSYQDNIILSGCTSKVIKALLSHIIQTLGSCTDTQPNILFSENLAIEHPVYNFQVSIYSQEVHFSKHIENSSAVQQPLLSISEDQCTLNTFVEAFNWERP